MTLNFYTNPSLAKQPMSSNFWQKLSVSVHFLDWAEFCLELTGRNCDLLAESF